ncbi:hypothetical protein [Cellulomonas citrea]|uniref:hypothetical protein n=1 Tax=Cellulomonas citrea TaxID=1909423 RepID=UPI0013583805|nr:hypothetical protein [Cellulomonas citrea]
MAVALVVALTQATIAIVLGVKRQRLARRKVASLVSTWVEHAYVPSPAADYYRRTVVLHIANESDEPVFKVEALCGIETERGTIQVGPLSAPRVIPVLPPKREFAYDVTMGMLGFGDFAHDAFRGLVAEIAFRDHEGVRWERAFDGSLKVVKAPSPAVVTEAGDELSVAQAGPIDNWYNPLGLVFAFADVASKPEVDDEEFRQLLIVNASGWSKSSAEDIGAVRKMFQTANVASHVWYPTPRIAYVRLLDELPGGAAPQRADVLTLVWRNGRGWTLFGVGPSLPWAIQFALGELEVDPLDGREQA